MPHGGIFGRRSVSLKHLLEESKLFFFTQQKYSLLSIALLSIEAALKLPSFGVTEAIVVFMPTSSESVIVDCRQT